MAPFMRYVTIQRCEGGQEGEKPNTEAWRGGGGAADRARLNRM